MDVTILSPKWLLSSNTVQSPLQPSQYVFIRVLENLRERLSCLHPILGANGYGTTAKHEVACRARQLFGPLHSVTNSWSYSSTPPVTNAMDLVHNAADSKAAYRHAHSSVQPSHLLTSNAFGF
ncbi:hypothetical protein XPA_010001 [Xanthoria parietina]